MRSSPAKEQVMKTRMSHAGASLELKETTRDEMAFSDEVPLLRGEIVQGQG